MQQIIFFFIRNKNFLLFFLLFILSIFLTIQAHSFHKNKYIGSANVVTGAIYIWKSNITDYFGLQDENDILIKENLHLRQLVEGYKRELSLPELDSITLASDSVITSAFIFIAAKVINNNYSKSKNNITIKIDSKDSVSLDMGVVTSQGIVGIINSKSENYATVQSILNTKSKINAKLKKSSHFGTLIWNTEEPNIVQLVDMPRLAPLKAGDTIVTGGRSTIFPEGILIGTVLDFSPDKDDNYYLVNIKLFNDMTSLKNVYLIENKAAEEILTLEKGVEDVEQ